MPNRAIEIHDSILECVSISQGRGELYFSKVCIHQSDGAPGVDAGSGWVQRAILRVNDVEMKGAFSEFPVDLGSGQIQIGEVRLSNTIPIPLRLEGAFELLLVAMWQGQNVVSITGSGVELELIGEPKYVEEFRPRGQS